MKHSIGLADFEGKMTSPSSTTTIATAPPASVLEEWKWPLASALALTAIFVLVFWHFLRRQVVFAMHEQADFGHTLIVPFIAAYFIYLNRQKLLAQPFRTTWLGLVPIILGVAAYIFCTVGPKPIQHHNLQAVGVAMTLGGLALLFCGWRAMLWLWFPLAYLFVFGQYISPRFLNIVTYKMQDIAAIGSHIFMLFMGMDVERSGNTLYIFDGGETKPLNIAEACSGMRMLMAFMALAVFMAYTGLSRFWQRALLVLMAVPTAIFVNILRVVTLSVLALYDAEFAAGEFHTFIGLVWLVPAFFVFLGVMWIIRNLVVEVERPRAALKGGAGPGGMPA